MKLEQFNDIAHDEAVEALLRCCHAPAWAEEVANRRPYDDAQTLYEAAKTVWWDLDRDDWLQAFDAHPKIGDVDSLRKKYNASRSWSEGEQQGVDAASEQTLQRLAQANDEYEERFGYIFIVCATGKSADEMLSILEKRLPNDPDEEIRIAAGEQAKITTLRLQKLLH